MEKTYEPESIWLITPSAGMVHPMFFVPDSTRVYVDLGCSHPVNKSLTAFVRDLGWRGVAVDGNPDYEEDWEEAGFKSHFFPAVLSDKPCVRFAIHENSFTSRISESKATDRPELWGINRVEERAGCHLERVLDLWSIDKIDLLTIDLEGHEFAVLKTLDFEKHQPSFIIAEYFTQGEGIDPRVFQFLVGEKGYEAIFMNESNLIYRRK